MKKIINVLLAAMIFAIPAFAKDDFQNSYNYLRAIEESEKGNLDEALDYLNKEIKEHPKNTFAYLEMAEIYKDRQSYDYALNAVNEAIKNTPKKEKKQRAAAQLTRGEIMLASLDTVAALQDFETAISLDPTFPEVYETRGQIYYELGKYDLSNADYSKLLELKPLYEIPLVGLGRNAYKEGNYPEALGYYNRVISIYPEYSGGYAFRAQTYLEQKEYVKAMDDICKALSINGDRKAFSLIFEFPKDKEDLVAAKLKSLALENPHSAECLFYGAMVYYENESYEKSVELLEKALEYDNYIMIYDLLTRNYRELGEFDLAMEYAEEGLNIDPNDTHLIALKAILLGDLGNFDQCFELWDTVIENNPDSYVAYYQKAWNENITGKTDEAIKDYNMVLLLNPDHAYAHLGLGNMYSRKGENEKAKQEYEAVVALDTVPTDTSCAMYALMYLGRNEEAKEFMDKMIALNPQDAGHYYDAACLYALMGEKETSLSNLKKSLELGFRRFAHIDTDDDMDSLRDTPEFNALMEQYRPLGNTKGRKKTMGSAVETVGQNGDAVEGVTVEIPFTPEAGCASVKCTVNDLPLTFIFDTGASMVSMSQVEANFMLKNGYLQPSDIVGTGRFTDANGDVSEGTLINLRNVEFGGLKLSNVKASVVRNQRAPLLLGQSVLSRLGSIEIDNHNKRLLIKK